MKDLIIKLSIILGVSLVFIGCYTNKPSLVTYTPPQKLNINIQPKDQKYAREILKDAIFSYFSNQTMYSWVGIGQKVRNFKYYKLKKLNLQYASDKYIGVKSLNNGNDVLFLYYKNNNQYDALSISLLNLPFIKMFYIPMNPSIISNGSPAFIESENKYILLLKNIRFAFGIGIEEPKIKNNYWSFKTNSFLIKQASGIFTLGFGSYDYEVYHSSLRYLYTSNPYEYKKINTTNVIALPFDTQEQMLSFAQILIGAFPQIMIK